MDGVKLKGINCINSYFFFALENDNNSSFYDYNRKNLK